MKRNSIYLKIATGVSLLLVGTLVLFSDYIKEKRDVVFSDMNLALTELQEEVKKEEQEVLIPDSLEIERQDIEEKKEEQIYEKYLGTLSIPKINLYRGFYDKNSKLNKVDKNLYVLPQSDYPDVSAGNLMIAGHSGTSNIAYFKDLYQLEVSDEITINYNEKIYIYIVEKIYDVEKTGSARILRNTTRTTLTLITCTKNDDAHQTIYIAYLDRIE